MIIDYISLKPLWLISYGIGAFAIGWCLATSIKFFKQLSEKV